jgi:hypothetical protein
MAVPVPLVGAALGVGVQVYVNAVRKLPLMRNPWLHVLCGSAGYGFGSWLVEFEAKTHKDLTGETHVQCCRMALQAVCKPCMPDMYMTGPISHIPLPPPSTRMLDPHNPSW